MYMVFVFQGDNDTWLKTFDPEVIGGLAAALEAAEKWAQDHKITPYRVAATLVPLL